MCFVFCICPVLEIIWLHLGYSNGLSLSSFLVVTFKICLRLSNKRLRFVAYSRGGEGDKAKLEKNIITKTWLGARYCSYVLYF